jgi:hypothetical protein
MIKPSDNAEKRSPGASRRWKLTIIASATSVILDEQRDADRRRRIGEETECRTRIPHVREVEESLDPPECER